MAATSNKVTRITAKDDAPKSAKAVGTKVQKTEKAKKQPKAASSTSRNVFKRIWEYFKGAWVELRLVRWPNRRATWGLTIAVILFSLFFVVVVILLDMLFKYLFQLIIA